MHVDALNQEVPVQFLFLGLVVIFTTIAFVYFWFADKK